MTYFPSRRVPRKPPSFMRVSIIVALSSILAAGGIWLTLFVTGVITIGGVPYSVLIKFWGNEAATSSYFQRDANQLHEHLRSIGIEEEMKEYYRKTIPDEVELDQHIHQIFYDRTGYVGRAYRVNSEGILVLKKRNLFIPRSYSEFK